MTLIPVGQHDDWVGCAVVFEADDPPRTGRMSFWSPDGSALPDRLGRPGELTVVVAEIGSVQGESPVRECTVPSRQLPVADAVRVLLSNRDDQRTHRATAFWRTAARMALQLIARGRLLPGVSSSGFDAWRIGPWDAADLQRLRELSEAMPPEARAVPLSGELELPAAYGLVRGFCDAVADASPRTAAAARASGGPLFASVEPQPATGLREWARDVAAGMDSGVRVSLRLESSEDDPDFSTLRAVVQCHSLADPGLVADAADLWAESGSSFGPGAPMDAMLAVRRAARAWPPLERLLHLAVPDEITLADDELYELLGDASPRLAAAGVEVHWPKELVHELSSRAVVADDESPPTDLRSFLGGDQSLSLRWQLALGGEPLTDAEIDELATAHRPVVRLRDQWLLLDPELARRARDRALAPLPPVAALGAALTGTAAGDRHGEAVEVVTSGWLDALRQRLQSAPEPVAPPAGLAATLRDYQLQGLSWLHRMTSLGLGGCLADDMGLGKTITLIALHLHRQASEPGPTLVVCPASLLGNWEREITRFAPGVAVRRFHGAARSVERITDGFVLTTYGTMRLDVARLAEVEWGLLVADEAQHVKNPVSGTAKALRKIPATARIALTGTPVENNLSELWAILDWTTPGLLGTLAAFRARWATPVEADRDRAATQRLSTLVGPFLLRRRKSDPGIAPELPPKTETDQPVALSREQAGLYEAVVRETLAQIKSASGISRLGLVIKLLTALKQICNHPAHYLREAQPRLSGRSGKLELLDELVDTIVAEDGAVLVFTQYVAMARLLEKHLATRGIATQLLHGGTPVGQREQMVQRFQDGAAPVFLLSLKAAGTGLNLTRADHVVHYDRWWNPAVEEQATDRAYRIGQTRPVQVHRLVVEGTVEDRIAAMLRDKRDLADSVLSSGESALAELSDDDLADLVELRSTR